MVKIFFLALVPKGKNREDQIVLLLKEIIKSKQNNKSIDLETFSHSHSGD